MSGADDIIRQTNRKHSSRSKKKQRDPNVKRKNNKAFNVANAVSAKRNMQRNLDKAQQKEVVPLLNREEETPPPSLVVVMGPKACGKTTLIRSLVKIYTGQNMTDTTGPITVIAGNKKRFTFFESPLDLYSLTDLAKVPDLVLLMIDASYGLEMETFEYLNLLQLHGFPKVIGILTHLDRFRSMKSLQNTKKEIKHRFWTEIYKGAKLFDFMGVINGKYRKHEVKRLSLHINRVKFRPLVWHNTHPYLVVDRVEDVTPISSQAKSDRNTHFEDKDGDSTVGEKEISVYGYVRGCHLKTTTKIHLVGAGDFDIHSIAALPDPCPLRSKEAGQGLRLSRKKDHLLYAPMANVGRVSMDKDSLYIDLKRINYTKKDQLYLPDQSRSLNDQEDENEDYENGTPMQLLRSMQDVHEGVDQQLKRARGELSLFANEAPVDFVEDESDYDEDTDEEDGRCDDEDDGIALYEDEYDENESNGDDNDFEEEEGDSENEEMMEGSHDYRYDPEGSMSLTQDIPNPSHGFLSQRQSFNDIMKTVYGASWVQSNKGTIDQGKVSVEVSQSDGEEDDFFTIKNKSSKVDSAANSLNQIDCSRYHPKGRTNDLAQSFFQLRISELSRSSPDYLKLKSRFVTGGYKRPISGNSDQSDDAEDGDDSVYGDFEDLEATNNDAAARTDQDDGIESRDSEFSDSGEEDEDSEAERERLNDDIDEQLRLMNAKKKSLFKMKFDHDYDKQKSGDRSDEEESESGDETEPNRKAKKRGKKGDEGDNSEEEEEGEEDVNLIEKAQRDFELQSQRNQKEFGDEGELARHRYEGFRQGLYVRIHLKGVPREFLDNFSATRPMIVGGLLPSETSLGFITARVKRHRWHKRILKSNDPLIFSIGWRRFQSIPVYTTTDQNERERFLKYTPEQMHCTATFYGPLIAPNTGILAYQTIDDRYSGFRIALTGTALEQRATPQVVKKLKLTGTPVKIFKSTAFITGMFNSALEVAKFEQVKIKTVSGIRGSIKKAVNAKNDVQGLSADQQRQLGRLPPGTFRATFEDKILMSDIVICRVWVNVEVKKFYNPVLSLLSRPSNIQTLPEVEAPPDGEGESEQENTPNSLLMRSTSQLRRELKIPQVVKKDSVYRPVERQQREFSKLRIPAKLQDALPFASKPKQMKRANPESYLSRRAVVLEPEERKQRGIVQMISTIRKDKDAKRKAVNKQRMADRQKQLLREREKFSDIHKQEKKRKYREIGREEQRKRQKSQ